MKLKMLKLLLLFLATGLFVSSKETTDKTKSTCSYKCLQEKKYSATGNDNEQKQIANYQLVLAPGSYIFYY
jgi:hypothetical protein